MRRLEEGRLYLFRKKFDISWLVVYIHNIWIHFQTWYTIIIDRYYLYPLDINNATTSTEFNPKTKVKPTFLSKL